jgi:hypothetical protein
MPFWWVGTTYFCELDDEDTEESLEWQPAMVRGLVRAGGTCGQGILEQDLAANGIDRFLLAEAQKTCLHYGPIFAAVEAEIEGSPSQKAVEAFFKTHASRYAAKNDKRKPAAVLQTSQKYEIHDGLLYRRVYDEVDHEIQLRLVAPEGTINRFEFPGLGEEALGIREKVLLHYHNSVLGGHLGSDITAERIKKDWHWRGLYADVDKWCSRCDLCKGEKGHTATSGWTRTELYSRPFRVIQFDTIECSKLGDGGAVAAAEHGMKHVLTAICCLSRFVWLIPIQDATAERVGRALLEHVLLGMGMFPAVLRSDRANAFTGSVLAYINQQLEIKHILDPRTTHSPRGWSRGCIGR